MDFLTMIRAQWDRALAVGCTAAGVIVLVVGWFGVSETPYPAEQLPYILSAGLGGLFLLGVASVLWLSADLRDEWRKLDAIEQALRNSPWQHDDEPAAINGQGQPARDDRIVASETV